MSKPTGLEKERQGLKGIPQVARKSPTSGQKLKECYAQLLAGEGGLKLPHCQGALLATPWKQQMSECGSLQITFTQHKRGKKQQPPASEILFAGPSEEHKGSVLLIL